MLVTLLVTLLACDGQAPGPTHPTGPGGLPAYDQAATQHIQLHLLDGRYTLGAPTLPASVDAPDTFVLAHEEVPNPQKVPRKLTMLRAPLPFPVSAEEQRFAPVGLEVFVGDEKLPFSRTKAAFAANPTWRVTGQHLVIAYPDIPPPGAVRVTYPGVQNKLDRHDPAASGLEAADFVRSSLTLNQHTRHGLVLPAPSSAAYAVTLPEGSARFETWLAMKPPPLNTPKSDGALAVLSIVAGGETIEVATEPIAPQTPGFTRWEVDLSRWAGQAVELVLETRALQHNHFDWVFLGAPSVWGPPTGDVRRVVVLAMDTTRPDHFGFYGYPRGTTPRMDVVGGQSVTFDRTWSTAPRTRPAFRSATTGRLPLKAVGATNISEVFQRNGFTTAGIVANVHLQPRFDFDRGFDTWLYDGKADAVHQVDRALEWMRDNVERDTYLFLHFMDPHLPYRAPGEFETKFVDEVDPDLPQHFNRWEVNRWSKRKGVSDVRRKHIEGLHDGEMAYMDSHLGRFFEQLDALPGRTLVVVHSDHGEEFWEHGGFEHNHTLFDEVTRAVLWFRPGGGVRKGGRRVDTPASLIDIGPTLYDLFGFDDVPDTDGKSLRPFLEGRPVTDWPERPIPVAYLQYERERWGVVFRDHKYILHTASGEEELFDLRNDPGETVSVASQHDLQPWREALGAAHDVPVLPGLRISVKLAQGDAEPLTVTLPAPAVGADVLDPEAALVNRANREWGEPPRKIAAEIGAVTLAEDGRSLTFTPGPDPQGIVWVQFQEGATADGVALALGSRALPLEAARWSEGSRSIGIEAGPVLVPPPAEADLMAALRGADDADPETIQLLKDLGYIH